MNHVSMLSNNQKEVLRVVRAIRKEKGEPVRTSEVREEVGKSAQYTSDLLGDLVEAGEIGKLKQGVYDLPEHLPEDVKSNEPVKSGTKVERGNGSASNDQNAYHIPMDDTLHHRRHLVVDRREVEQHYNGALDRVRVHRNRSNAMDGVVAKDALIQYVEDATYEGPGMYLISLAGETKWPAYVRWISKTEIEIATKNRKEPIRLVREEEGDEWHREGGGPVDFELHGSCERWESDRVEL